LFRVLEREDSVARDRVVTGAHSDSGRVEPETLRIWLLGGFRVSVGTRTVEDGQWRLKKGASLVKLLALAPDHGMHRERVIDLLWPDLGPSAAANNLHRTLHSTRRVLAPNLATASRYLRFDDERLRLCPTTPLWVDVEAFESAAATARRTREPAAYQAAIDLYAGELLPEDRYREWAEVRRDALRETHFALLAELAGLYEERGEFAPAVGALERALMFDPAREEAHYDLMRLYALAGQHHKALFQYERLRKALSREFGSEPGAQSKRLYQELRSGRIPAEDPSGAGSAAGRSGPPLHNLPAPQSSFVGREREKLEVKRALSMTRLLTLTGMGGSGKTRLSLEVARDTAGAYQDGAWLVELAPLSEGAQVPHAVARALEVHEQPGHPIVQTLVENLRSRRMLLILDNCEHLVDASARLVDRLLGSCEHLRVLATSRETLGVAGEVNWPVPSLTVPDQASALQGLMQYEAVQLFVERARSRLPTFALTPENAGSVVSVCRKLDGIPLAIELVTARMAALAVEQIVERLDDSLGLLTTGNRTAAPRQQTLKATLEWSYDLLDEHERRLFARLSVFAGGWTLEAAEAVGAGDPVPAGRVLDLLSKLVDKSLVVVDASP
jgi:predicted ATPase/DNA-binding SARP family transcriptional activator